MNPVVAPPQPAAVSCAAAGGAQNSAVLERVLDLRPHRVLQIGVGSGLTVSALAPSCDEFWGMDPSADTIAAVRSWLHRDPDLAGRVELRELHAFALDALPFEYFDGIVINGAALALPTEAEVLRLLHAVLPKLAVRGAVYFEALRNPRLLAYRDVVTRGTATVGVPPVEPAFFAGLRAAIRGLGAVDVRLAKASLQNPLTRDRYYAVLHKEPADPLPMNGVPTLRWNREVIDLAGLASVLGGPGLARIRVVGVPDKWLLATARARNGKRRDETGVDPLDLVNLGERLGYRVLVTWSSMAVDHKLDLLFLNRRLTDDRGPVELYRPAGWMGTLR